MLTNCAPLLSAHWIPSLIGLIDKLGPENVFVSILENGSVDNTRAALQELESMLTERNVPYTFRYEESFRDGVKFQADGLLQRLLGEEGTNDNWIMTDGGWFPRRISYLAQLRNLVLEPLRKSKQTFDKVLFINDVIFSVLPFAGVINLGRRRNEIVTYEQRTSYCGMWLRLQRKPSLLRHICNAR